MNGPLDGEAHAETNDLVLQLRKRGIDRVILAGMSANHCAGNHMRELVEEGFEVLVVKDAATAAQVTEGDGCQSALVNCRFIDNSVLSSEGPLRKVETTPIL